VGTEVGRSNVAGPIAKGGRGSSRRRRSAVAVTAVFLFLLALTSQASALTLGVGWTGAANNVPEMPLVGASGAATFRVPASEISEKLVETAAESHVTILAQLGGGDSLPSDRAGFRQEAINLVETYGVNGKFWKNHSTLPPEPITTWEVWNEPNLHLHGNSPAEFGSFVSEVAEAIHTHSPGGSPEVLFGGIPYKENGEIKRKGSTLNAALKYLEEANGSLNSYVDGIAIHPYENNPKTFFTPEGGEQYDRIEAFRFAVNRFHTTLVELGSSKSLSITEAGWAADGKEWNVSEAEQASLLSLIVAFGRNNESSLNLKNLDWYNFRDAGPPNQEWAQNCGLRAKDGHFRQSWTAFQAAAGVRQFIPQPPVAITGAATGVGETEVTVNGTVDPKGIPTTYKFEYGTAGGGYTSSQPVPDGSAGSGEGATSVSAVLKNLSPVTEYGYRLVAVNAMGTSYGEPHTFRTAAAPAPAVVVDQSGIEHTFSRSPNGELEEWYQEGTRWVKRLWGGAVAGTPSAFVGADGTIWVYYRNTSNQLVQWNFKGSNWHVEQIGGFNMAGDPSAFEDAEGKRWIYFRSTSNQLIQWWLKGTNFHEEGIGGFNMAGDPSAFEDAEGKRWIYFRSTSNQLFQWWLKGTNFHEEGIGGLTLASDPTAVSLPEGQRNIVYLDSTSGPSRWYLKGTAFSLTHFVTTRPFQGSTKWNGWPGTYSLSLVDLNGDKKADLVGRNSAGELWAALSTGSTFASGSLWANWPTSYSMVFGDVNGDGKADVLGVGPTGDARVSLSTGSSFATSTYWAGWPTNFTAALADVNGDGKADLVGRNSAGELWVALSTGSSFAAGSPWASWPTTYSMEFADVNGDGKADVIGRNTSTGEIRVSLSTGSSFAPSTLWGTLPPAYSIQLADVNGDGKADMIGRLENSVLVGLAESGHFGIFGEWSPWSVAYSAQLADVTGDGRADLVGRDPATGDVQVGLNVK
jgi:hypothetical protein